MKWVRWLAVLTLLIMSGTSCGDGELSVQYPTVTPDNLMTIASALRPSEREQRAILIRDAARERGLNNAWLLAGIADVETNLAHCWSEARWACKGPASSSCNGGPIIAGSADGPCSHQQGGLGMFQFDAGTYSQTLAREGRGILTIEGNTQSAIEFVTDKVRISDFISGVNSDAEALAWMNRLEPDTTEWDQWVRTITGYYNGCFQGRCSKYRSQYNKYDTRTRAVLHEFGPDFWGSSIAGTGSTGTTTTTVGAPAVATDLTQTTGQVPNGGSVGLRWVSVGATRFVIRAEYKADGYWRQYWEWTRNAPVFELWPQVANTEYRWQVQACNSNGCAEWSEVVSFIYGTAPAGSTHTGNTGTNNTGTGTTTTPADTTTENDPVDNSTPVDNTPDPQPEPAPQTSGVPGMPASMAPAGVYIETPDVPLSWSQPSGAASYDILMYYFDGTDWRDYYVWEGKLGGAFTVWPVVDETYYAWAIRACSSMGCSEWSDFQQFYFGPL